MKLDRETAEALVRLSANGDFQQFLEWLDVVQQAFVNGAVMGYDEKFGPDVLRGRAQGVSILKSEMQTASDVVTSLQKVG